MTRFVMLVGVAVVAAAMYVAASPASPQSTGVSVKQFNALSKKVAAQGKTIKSLKELDKIEVEVIAACDQVAVPVDQFGDGNNQTSGYEWSNDATPDAGTTLVSALDVAPLTDQAAVFFTGGDETCGILINGGGLRHAAAGAGITLPLASTHRWSFTARRR